MQVYCVPIQPLMQYFFTNELLTNLCSATYVRRKRGTARIHPLHVAAAAIDRYFLPAGPTAANLHAAVEDLLLV